MYFKRKAYNKLIEWKNLYSDKYAVLLEGARRVGKSTIAENFAKNEYKSYILIDFSKITSNILECFGDIGNLNIFFLRLQAETGITLYEHESLIIFDEVQLFPKARQAIKHLVFDGRYSYLETGSLISIKKNVKDILIPSEEMKIQIYPMDYEEFCDATESNYELLRQIYNSGAAIKEAEGQAQAILAVQQANADGIRALNESSPSNQVLTIKSLEAFAKAADGKSTKIIIPSEIQGIAGLASSLVEVAKKDN